MEGNLGGSRVVNEARQVYAESFRDGAMDLFKPPEIVVGLTPKVTMFSHRSRAMGV